jgi:hypothetical protein
VEIKEKYSIVFHLFKNFIWLQNLFTKAIFKIQISFGNCHLAIKKRQKLDILNLELLFCSKELLK